MGSLRVMVQPHAPEHLKQLIHEGLVLYNVAATGLAEYCPVSIFLKDVNDEVLGGVLGHIWGGWLSIAALWVAEPAPRAGIWDGAPLGCRSLCSGQGLPERGADDLQFPGPAIL